LARGATNAPPDDLELLLRVARAGDLPRDSDGGWGLTEADLGGIAPGTAPTRVLGSFSPHTLELSLEQTGLLAAVRERGFANPVVAVDPGSALGDTIRLFGDAERRELLMELRVNRSRRVVSGMEVLYVEWLKLQNPRAQFGAGVSRLPGQEYPGLGLLREVVAWLVLVGESLGLDGLAARPAQYYMAALSRRHMTFLEPTARARFEALHQALGGLPLPQAEEALAQGRVRETATGRPVRWEPAVEVYPASQRLRALLQRRRGETPEPPRFVLTPLTTNR
jgi:hypothetical protein